MRLLVLQASIVITAMVATSALAAPSCPINYGPHADAKPNKLYLYFPTADDPTFPNVDPPASLALPPFITSSSPLHRFDTADLPNYNGTVTELRNAVSDVVADIYCEFNVQVIQTTTVPPSTEPRRNTVGIGTDANVVSTSDVACHDATGGSGKLRHSAEIPGMRFRWITRAFGPGLIRPVPAGPSGGALNGSDSTVGTMGQLYREHRRSRGRPQLWPLPCRW